MHFCASLLRISVVSKLLSFASAVNLRKQVKPNNRSVVPWFFLVYISLCEIYILLKKKRNLLDSFCRILVKVVRVIYAFWFQKWPTDGPSYDSDTRMLSVKIVHYQRVNCETFYKLRSEKKYSVCYSCSFRLLFIYSVSSAQSRPWFVMPRQHNSPISRQHNLFCFVRFLQILRLLSFAFVHLLVSYSLRLGFLRTDSSQMFVSILAIPHRFVLLFGFVFLVIY